MSFQIYHGQQLLRRREGLLFARRRSHCGEKMVRPSSVDADAAFSVRLSESDRSGGYRDRISVNTFTTAGELTARNDVSTPRIADRLKQMQAAECKCPSRGLQSNKFDFCPLYVTLS